MPAHDQSRAGRRSFTGRHVLLPAASERTTHLYDAMLITPRKTFLHWTFGRDTVIWRIWPAVLLHTLWAVVVTVLSLRTSFTLNIPPVLLTVLGMVIGFVISYRAMSGYDRYWTGRTYWGDVMRNSRTLGRLVWFHVPPILTTRTDLETANGTLQRSAEELNEVMLEKRVALDLVTAFAIATKHHLRSELGIYYEDLYGLVEPLHEHEHKHRKHHKHPAARIAGVVDGLKDAVEHPQEALVSFKDAVEGVTVTVDGAKDGDKGKNVEGATAPSARNGEARNLEDAGRQSRLEVPRDPVIPAVNAYGTFDPAHPSLRRAASGASSSSSEEGESEGERTSLLPSMRRARGEGGGFIRSIDSELVPFSSVLGPVARLFGGAKPEGDPERGGRSGEEEAALTHAKHRPRIAGGGENLPLDVLRCLSEWFSVLEARGTVPGTSLGAMIGTLAAFEDSLSGLERILTTPLPFVYSVHIRHTVWIYLFFLPFQLLEQFYWYTIFGVAIASFIYLGFLAAGEEIEQPFGYDENDLDLDLFCTHVVRADVERLKRTACANAYLPAQNGAEAAGGSMKAARVNGHLHAHGNGNGNALQRAFGMVVQGEVFEE